jgi:hypothetical protein
MKSIIRNFIAKMVAGRSDDGIMITLKDPKKVDFQTAMMEDLLMRNGIDPSAIKSEAQLKGLLNQIDAMTKQSTTTSGIRNTESAKVFDLEGKEIPKGSKIIGGKAVDDDLPPPGSRGGPDDIAAPVQSQEETLRNMTEAEIKREIEENNKSAVKKILERKNREDVYGLEDYDTTNMSDIKKEIIRTETKLGNLNPDDPGFREKAKPLVDKITELQKKLRDDKAEGGIMRLGLKDGTPNKKITIDVAGSKSGKQQIMNAPEGITADRESINAIINADIPISQKIDLLAKYQYGKGRTRIERDGQEIFMDEGGFKSRDIGLGFNKDGEGIGGTLMYNMETGKPEFNIGFRKTFKEGSGMTRRTFLKFLAGAASIPIIGKIFKPLKVGKTVTKVPIIKTADVAGKPEWFDQLVNKVILEGDDVTKKFATGERQVVHVKKLDEDTTVSVTQDMDNGVVRVEYDSPANTFEDTVSMQYKKPLPDEGAPNPAAEFEVAESGPVGRADGPDDFDIDIDEVGGTSIKDLDSDVSKLKAYATGEKPTMKELVQNIERRKRARQITEDPEAQSDAVIRRQGDYDPSYYDDFASGGIARMLGE